MCVRARAHARVRCTRRTKECFALWVSLRKRKHTVDAEYTVRVTVNKQVVLQRGKDAPGGRENES